MVSIIEKLEGIEQTDRNAMYVSPTSARKAREVYWMKELRTVFPYGFNCRIGDETAKTTETRVGTKFRVLPRKNRRIGRRISHNDIFKIKPTDYINEMKNILETKITNAPFFVRTSLFSMKSSSLESVHQLLNDLLSTESSTFLYKQFSPMF